MKEEEEPEEEEEEELGHAETYAEYMPMKCMYDRVSEYLSKGLCTANNSFVCNLWKILDFY